MGWLPTLGSSEALGFSTCRFLTSKLRTNIDSTSVAEDVPEVADYSESEHESAGGDDAHTRPPRSSVIGTIARDNLSSICTHRTGPNPVTHRYKPKKILSLLQLHHTMKPGAHIADALAASAEKTTVFTPL